MKYSIVVATYNRKDALMRLIRGILAQDHQDFELIIVDDGSTDGTGECVASLEDARVRYEALSKNHGTATPARNRGIDIMHGDALVIWDSDDVLYPNALATLEHGFREHPEVGIVCTSTHFYRRSVIENLPRIPTRMLSADEWFCGVRPQDAEIIAVRKEHIGAVRFEARGIDFMFYAKIIGGHNASVWYINETCGAVYLESDPLSLTIARKKRNIELSKQRAPLLDDFLTTYGDRYLRGGAEGKYAGHAFGSAFGYMLRGEYRDGRRMLRQALRYSWNISWVGLYLLLFIPGGGRLARFVASR